ncbi:MAG: tetratricopeptide repeat protein [candidate division WOR-3 bacterium]
MKSWSNTGCRRASRRGLLAAAVAAGLVAAVASLPALRNELVWDDTALVLRSRTRPLATFGQSFWQGAAEVLDGDPYYRPLVNFSLGLERAVAGGSAWHFHLVNVLLHGVVVGLFAWLVGVMAGSVPAGGIAGLLFGLHPLLADSVAYVSGRTDILAGLGLLVACLGVVWWRRRPCWQAVVVVLAGFAVAVFSKESGLLFLGPGVAGLLVQSRQGGGLRSDRLAAVGLVLVAAGYLTARQAVLGSLVGISPAGTAGEVVGLALNEFGRGLVRFTIPFGQPLFEWRGAVSGRLDAYALAALGYLLLPILLTRLRQRGLLLVAWAWGLLFLLPFAALSQFGPTGRLLYLPGMGLVVMVAVVGLQVAGHSRIRQRLAAAAGIGLAAAFVPFLVARTAAWRNETGLFRRMTQQAPTYARGHYNLGTALLAAADPAGAAEAFSRALVLDSGLVQACLNLGALRQQQGELAEAAALYRRAVKSRPDYAPTRVNLGIVLHKTGDRQGAVAELRRGLELDPRSVGAAFNLAWLFHLYGEPDSARKYAVIALQMAPDDSRVRGLVERLGTGQHPPDSR